MRGLMLSQKDFNIGELVLSRQIGWRHAVGCFQCDVGPVDDQRLHHVEAVK